MNVYTLYDSLSGLPLMRPVLRTGYDTFTDEEPITIQTLEQAKMEAKLHMEELKRDVLVYAPIFSACAGPLYRSE